MGPLTPCLKDPHSPEHGETTVWEKEGRRGRYPWYLVAVQSLEADTKGRGCRKELTHQA